jgi:hypothetical protein
MTTADPKPMDPERPELPPGVTVKQDETGKWTTDYGGGFGVDGYDSREEAIDCTWTAWRYPPDPWVAYADSQAARAEQAERERDEALNNVATAHANARDEDDADALLRGWLAGAGDREKTQQWLNGENPWWHEANEDARAVERLQAEVTRLRARVRVQAEDVERAGVMRDHVEAWLRANGWGTPTPDKYGWTSAESETGVELVDLWRTDGSTPVAQTVCFIADDVQRPGLDILDEMAAMQVEPERAANHALDK